MTIMRYYLSRNQTLIITVIVTTATTCPTVQSGYWRLIYGSQYCDITDGGRCVTDGVGNYGNNEYCEVEALQTLKMTTEQYDVEEDYDFVTVKGIEYKRTGSSGGPNGVALQAGDKWTWESDWSTHKRGFKICGR